MHVDTGPNEPLLVDGDAGAVEPGCSRIGTGEDERVGDRVLFLGTGPSIAPPHALETLVRRAEELKDLGLIKHCDARRTRDPFAEVARPCSREPRPAHQHANASLP